MKYFIVKLGGSIITNKSDNQKIVKKDLLQKLFLTLKGYCQSSGEQVLISHGAGSFGHQSAKILLEKISYAKLRHEEIHLELMKIQDEVKSLNQIVTEYAYKFLGLEYIKEILHGDVNFEGPNYIVSTEEKILQFLKGEANNECKKVIFLTDQDGLMYGESLIPEIDCANLGEYPFYENKDATGGMKQKVSMACKISEYCQEIVILNGTTAEPLLEELNDYSPIGTRLRTK